MRRSGRGGAVGLVAFVAAVLVGCGADLGPEDWGDDAGTADAPDGGSSSGVVTGPRASDGGGLVSDAAGPSAKDAGDAPEDADVTLVDAGEDATVAMDAGEDAAADAAPDAGPGADAGDAGPIVCDPGLRACGGACVSMTDPNHCGGCGQACPAPPVDGSMICDGKCLPRCPGGYSLVDGGTRCALVCPAGTHECGGKCVDSTSVDSCGSRCSPCTNVAPAHGAVACLDGACGYVCATSHSACFGGCYACCDDAECPGPLGGPGKGVCDSAARTCRIACDPGTTLCGASCSDITSDPKHCGSCDKSCQVGEVCRAGACVSACTPPQSSWSCRATCVAPSVKEGTIDYVTCASSQKDAELAARVECAAWAPDGEVLDATCTNPLSSK